jgi:glycosyltransferase involved in cell wall biosynthesis
MRIAVFNAHLGLAGGGEILALNMTRALEESGFNVNLITYRYVVSDYERVFKFYPHYKPKNVIIFNQPFITKVLGIGGRFRRLRVLLLMRDFFNKIKNEGYNIVIDTSSNMPTVADVVYVHYPSNIVNYSKKRIYGNSYEWLVKRISKNVLGNPKIILCNSSWTAEKFKSIYGGKYKVDVLHPPVDVEYFKSVANNKKREKIIVTLSRFAPEKNLEKILDVANLMRDYKFVLIGSTANYSKRLLSILEEKKRKLKLDNIDIKKNVSREEVKEILGKAKYYLHPPFAEHFGIAIVEAMSAGLIPIVYEDGGGWTDIVSNISSYLGYTDISKVPNIIRKIDEDQNLYEALREKSLEASSRYSYEEFKRRFTRVINSLVEGHYA